MTKLIIPDEVLNTRVDLVPMEDLEQFGIKGMRWGVRKDKKGGGSASNVTSTPSAENYKAQAAIHTAKAEEHLTAAKTYKALAEHYQAGHPDPPGYTRPKGMSNEKLAKNASNVGKQAEGLASKEMSKAHENISKAHKETGDTLTALAEHFEAGHKDPPGYTRPKGMTNEQLAKNARTSASQAFKLAKEEKAKADRYASESEKILDDPNLKHTSLVELDDLLQYGKKGMKWGIRKDKTGSSKSSAKSMSDKELKDAVARMNLERSYNKLLADKSPSSTTSRGAKIVGGMIGNAAKQAAQNYMQQAFSAAIKAGVTAAVKKAGGSLPDFPKDD